ncbi:MAG TPA: ankyrin repeat domain-containing protein [Vicinamibacterales bacterium]|nr:ankyrin repeat domain-containing protein [Vicinamibacterales bacterium]
MRTRTVAAWALLLGIIGVALYGYRQGTPQDIVNAVRRGDLASVSAQLARDPSLVHTRVYPQGLERVTAQRDYQTRTGQSAWKGRYLIHDAAARVDAPGPMLDALAAAGADLNVRLEGRSLLHLTARDGNVEVGAWLLDRGADIDARNDCADNCTELGRTPLHDAVAFAHSEMIELLLARGASAGAVSGDGLNALHVAAAVGLVDNAWLLCRYGVDPTLKDAQGRLPAELASDEVTLAEGFRRAEAYGAGTMADWLKAGGGCDTLSARARDAAEPVGEDDARAVFGAFLCARGVSRSCTQAPTT